MASKFLFVAPTGSSKSQRQKELDSSARKAHTAKINHIERKRKLKQHKANDNEHGTPQYGRDKEFPHHQQNHINSCSPPREVSIKELSRARHNTGLRAKWGNCDPFSCQVIPVTPRTNQVISFFRFYSTRSWSTSFMLQLIRNDLLHSSTPGSDSVVGKTVANELWGQLLETPTGFWPVVGSLIPLMRQLMPEDIGDELNQLALQMRSQNLKSLRKSIEDFESMPKPPITLIYHVKGLFREACIAGDPDSARVHANMLCKLAERLASYQKDQRDISVYRVGLWSDASTALMQQRRPILAAADWMPQTMPKVWDLATSVLPEYEETEENLFPGISNNILREAFLFIRHALYISKNPIIPHNREEIRNAEIIFHWTHTKAEHHTSNLLNLYFDLTEYVDGNATTEVARYTEAAIAVALLYYLQKSFGDATQADGADILESAKVLHPLMMSAAKTALVLCSDVERELYQATHLWLLYVGAYCEERLCFTDIGSSRRRGVAGLPCTWFHKQLARKALETDLACWTDILPVLNQFVFVDYLKPHPDQWFDCTISTWQNKV